MVRSPFTITITITVSAILKMVGSRVPHERHPRDRWREIRDGKRKALYCTSTFQALSCCCQNPGCDTIRITICRWAAVLHVASSLLFSRARNANRCTTIGKTEFKLSDAACLMLSCEALVIPFTVLSNMLLRFFAEGFAFLFDHVITSRCTHLLDREVCVASSAIPVPISGFRTERNRNIMRLGDTIHDVAHNRHMVANLGSSARADLVLPLSRHDLSVDASDFDACLQAH